ncbi:MAG: hypothetical protein AAF152_07095 [Cyanobacteria bacterium P01_A01_bin.114]
MQIGKILTAVLGTVAAVVTVYKPVQAGHARPVAPTSKDLLGRSHQRPVGTGMAIYGQTLTLVESLRTAGPRRA